MRAVIVIALAAISAGCATGATPTASRDRAAAQMIARAYGVDRFDRVASVHFIFHAQRGEQETVREWRWDPHARRVTYRGLGPDGTPLTHAYRRKRLWAGHRTLNEQLDRWFVNDEYWLFFPFHLAWDEQAVIEADGAKDLPIPPGRAQHLTITYPKTGGYTPGDAYELFYDPDGLILQWVYRKGNQPTPTLIATWEEHTRIGPMTVSLRHRSVDNAVRVWFTDVAVRLAGRKGWIRPASSKPGSAGDLIVR